MTVTQYHNLPDNRRLAYCTYGDPTGYPIFYAHGSPGCRIEGELFHEAAKWHGFRLIATDRPGFGRSSKLNKRALLDYPADLKSLADELRLDDFGVIGWSGGGAPTIACGSALPNRVRVAIVIGSYTNFGEFPEGRQMLPKADQLAFRLGEIHPVFMRFFFKLLQLYLQVSPVGYINSVLKAACEMDRQLFSDENLQHLFLADQQEALVQGVAGLTQDAQIQYQDWDYQLDSVKTRLHIFQGGQDHYVPSEFAEHLSQAVPESVLHFYPEQGHFLPLAVMEDIMAVAHAEINA